MKDVGNVKQGGRCTAIDREIIGDPDPDAPRLLPSPGSHVKKV